jgi:hypothetical protein
MGKQIIKRVTSGLIRLALSHAQKPEAWPDPEANGEKFNSLFNWLLRGRERQMFRPRRQAEPWC